MLKARVKKRRNGEDLTAVQPQGELPTLAQAIEIREMERARQAESAPMLSANAATSSPMEGARAMNPMEGETAQGSAMRAKVKAKGPKPGDDIYDLRIGGYGASLGPQESGEAAVRRIQEERKAKVRRKGK
jgi:hypothetical protein